MYLKLNGKKLEKKRGEPNLPDSGINLKTVFCGICGSDKHRIRNGFGNVLGHENVARVVDENSDKFSKGDIVAVNPLIPCGKCEMCENHKSNLCENMSSLGKDLPGGFSSKIKAPEENLYRLNEKSKKYTLADPLAVVIHAIKQIDIEDKKVLVIGDGALGALICFILSGKAKRIILKGKNRQKTQKILENTEAITTTKYDSYDVIFEAVGGNQTDTINFASQKISKKGKICVLGVFPDKKLNINIRPALEKEAKIIGINSFRNDKEVDDFKEAIEIIKKTPLERLVSLFDASINGVRDAIESNAIKPSIRYES